MPNPYNTRSAAGNLNNPQQDLQDISREMANQEFVGQNLNNQRTSMYQQSGQDDSYGDGIGQPQLQSNDFGQQQAAQTNNISSQEHEVTLADKVENMLEKLASKITGSNNNV